MAWLALNPRWYSTTLLPALYWKVTEEIVGVEPGEGLVIFGTVVMGVGVLGFSSKEALSFPDVSKAVTHNSHFDAFWEVRRQFRLS